MAKSNSSNKKQSFYLFLGILIFAGVAASVYYASKIYLNKNNQQVKTITNTITLNYTSKTNGITVTAKNKYDDEAGKKLQNEENIFDFVVNANIKNNTSTEYEIIAETVSGNVIPSDKVKLYLQRSDVSNYSSLKEVFAPKNFVVTKDLSISNKSGMLLEKGSFKKTTTIYYRLIVWVDPSYASENENDSFSIKVSIYAKV